MHLYIFNIYLDIIKYTWSGSKGLCYGEMWWNGKDCRQTTDLFVTSQLPPLTGCGEIVEEMHSSFLSPAFPYWHSHLLAASCLLPPFPLASAHLGSVGAVSRPVKLYLAVCRSRAEGEQLGSGGLDVGSSLVTLASVTSWPRDSAGWCDVWRGAECTDTEWPPDELWRAVTFSPDHVWCIIQSSETSNYDSKILETTIH